MPIHRRLARSIGVQGLRHEQRQRSGGWKQSFAMHGRVLIDKIQKIGSRQCVEEIVGMDGSRTPLDTVALRPACSTIRVHAGWRFCGPPVWVGPTVCPAASHLSNQWLGVNFG